MRTVISIIVHLLCCYSCRSNESDNAKLIRSIDNLKVIDSSYLLQVDSNGRFIDTLYMLKQKRDEKGNEVFREITSFDNGRRIVVKNYYRVNTGLFYSVTETEEGIFSLYENWQKDGKIHEALKVNFTKDGPDSIKMKFNYESREGKLKKLNIYEHGGTLIEETYYNQP